MIDHDQATLKDIYNLVDSKVDKLENNLKADIARVEGRVAEVRNDFMDMEKGRLTRAEQEIARLSARVAVQNTQEKQTSKLVWVFIGLGISIVQALLITLLMKHI